MKNIEITTPQNVTIRYGLATVWERAIALVLDLLIMTVVALLLFGILNFLVPFVSDTLAYFTVYPFLILYSLFFEQFNHGQSIGKRVMSIRVIRRDGERARFFDYLMRWIFRALDIYASLGSVAVLSVISSNYSQRLGDLLGNTVVVNVNKTERMKLPGLLKLNTIKPQKITYPQVTKLPEETMILVKETLGKKRELENEAHDQAFDLLVNKLQKVLDVKAPKDREQFLRTLLNDYIVLTR